jgi:hypothetical protein
VVVTSSLKVTAVSVGLTQAELLEDVVVAFVETAVALNPSKPSAYKTTPVEPAVNGETVVDPAESKLVMSTTMPEMTKDLQTTPDKGR